MNRLSIGFAALFCITTSAAFAQNAPPAYEADPSIYKVIFQDQNFRVIAATYKAGATDKPHSHTAPMIAYTLTDCELRISSTNGKAIDVKEKAGSAYAVPLTPSHTVENVGPTDCRVVLVERK